MIQCAVTGPAQSRDIDNIVQSMVKTDLKCETMSSSGQRMHKNRNMRMRISFIGQVCSHRQGFVIVTEAPQCNRMTDRTGHRQQKNNIQIGNVQNGTQSQYTIQTIICDVWHANLKWKHKCVWWINICIIKHCIIQFILNVQFILNIYIKYQISSRERRYSKNKSLDMTYSSVLILTNKRKCHNWKYFILFLKRLLTWKWHNAIIWSWQEWNDFIII